MKKVIVFGGAGFLGGYVSDELVKRGYKVVIYDLKPYSRLKKGQAMIIGDINDTAKVRKAMAGADIVYNFSAVSDIEAAASDPMRTVEVNIRGNTNILNVAREFKIKRFIFASSIYVYGNYGSFYRASKYSSELLIECFSEVYGIDYTILRYGSLYGKYADESNWIHRILKEAILTGRITRHGDGEEIREYIHVEDAARSSVDILSDDFINQSVVVTGHHPMKIKDLMGMVKEIMNNKVKIEYKAPKSNLHYEVTPYSFTPKIGKKLTSNYYIDFGQGILDCLHHISADISEEVKLPGKKR